MLKEKKDFLKKETEREREKKRTKKQHYDSFIWVLFPK